MNKPLFKHDCEHCVYFKTDKDEFGTISDIYVCGDCVTFRYSDDAANNRSVCFNNQGNHSEWYKEVNPYSYKILKEYKESIGAFNS